MKDTGGMEFSPTGWVAIYKPTPSNGVVVRPVEAWSDGRDALVADERTGRLVVASNSTDFVRLQKCSRVVSAIPAQPGWSLRIWEGNKDDGPTFTVPIAAWIVDEAGNLTPVGGSNGTYLEAGARHQRTEILYPAPEHLGQMRSGM
jgi:hypothetical protein